VRVVAVPGFSQSASAWRPVQDAAPDLDIVALEVPRGRTFADTARALGEAGGPGIYLGYSMGGRLCLELAVQEPDLLEGLVLVSSGPGIADEAERAARAEADLATAARVAELGVEAFLAEWVAQPIFATLPPARAQVAERAATHDVASLQHQLVALGQGSQPPRWEDLGSLDVPVMLLSGEADPKYDAIAEAMFDAIPDCLRFTLPGGHALPLEQPEAVAATLRTFLDDLA
jgi:2-succinyl-6-hydroxy-2,4-cyclohexadiene-1-carboxylate synthase